MLNYFIIIVVVGIISFVLLTYFSGKEEKKLAQETEYLLQEIDNKYQDFIEKQLNLAVLKKEGTAINLDEIGQKAFVILKPEIEGLIAFINSSSHSNVPVKHNSKHFNGIASLSRAYFKKTGASGNKTLTKQEEDKFKESFMDTIKANLTQRLLDLKANNFLDL